MPKVFDMRKLRTVRMGTVYGVNDYTTVTIPENLGRAHNLYVADSPELWSGKAHLFVLGAGSVMSQEKRGGLLIYDIYSNPAEPIRIAAHQEDGYTHDMTVAKYHGPDTRYQGKEIVFACNEDTLTIFDCSVITNCVIISRNSYAGQVYAHQGDISVDHDYYLLGDEGDKGITATFIFNISDLTSVTLIGVYRDRTNARAHNLYVRNVSGKGFAFAANYQAGLSIFDVSSSLLANGTMERVGYFDTWPYSISGGENEFAGAWTAYPFLPDNLVAVSNMENGLFLLRFCGFSSPAPTAGPTLTMTPWPTFAPTAGPWNESPGFRRSQAGFLSLAALGHLLVLLGIPQLISL